MSTSPEPANDSGPTADAPEETTRQSAEPRAASPEDHEAEQTLWRGGYSGKTMYGAWLLLVLVSIALVAAGILIAEFPVLIAVAVIAVIWLLGGAVYLWRRFGVAYELTTQRFIHQSGLLARRTDRIEVIDIDDVSYHQGPVQRLVGVGTIVLSSSDRSHPELTMVGIDGVADVAGLIDDTRRKERRRRSFHIERI